ncbi:MAG TPA: sensor histidine kinase, partial [Bacteroidia bacterium]|nr:sensor histidine kinase [Bacteroidia bacterium]
ELSYLKAQINPHFLFNTLNSIYSLAIQKSDETANAVVKLSGMMRYVLTESQNEFVSLQKELDYINNYIELQKTRLDSTIKLHYTITGTTTGKAIAPLILIPFIENAFKYGVNAEENSEITIEISVNEAAINLFVKNNKVSIRPDPENRSGLGIENTKSRLLLLYPGKHYLNIDDNSASFSVSLSIKS